MNKDNIEFFCAGNISQSIENDNYKPLINNHINIEFFCAGNISQSIENDNYKPLINNHNNIEFVYKTKENEKKEK